jgi:hypothetical protein
VHEELAAFAGALGLDELIAVTIVHDHQARLRSYDLLAGASGEVKARANEPVSAGAR